MGALKYAGVVAWCTAIAACIGLTAWSGIDAVGNAVASVGWGVPFVVLTRAATVSVAGVGWWLLFPARGRLRPRAAVLLRFVREAVNAVLPLTQVGGDIIGARLLTFWAVPGPLAAASIIIDVLIQAATQFLFAALGLAMLVALGADLTVAGIAATGLALAVPMLGGFYLAQRGGGHRILHFLLARLKGDSNWHVLGTVDAVYQSLSMIAQLHGAPGDHRRGAGDRKPRTGCSRRGLCRPKRARGPGGRPNPAVRHIRNSARSGIGAIAHQAGRRSRARCTRPPRTADPRRRASLGKLFTPRRTAANFTRSSFGRSLSHDMILVIIIAGLVSVVGCGYLVGAALLIDRFARKASSTRRASMPGPRSRRCGGAPRTRCNSGSTLRARTDLLCRSGRQPAGGVSRRPDRR